MLEARMKICLTLMRLDIGILVGRHFVHIYNAKHEAEMNDMTNNLTSKTAEIVKSRSPQHLLNHIKELWMASYRSMIDG